MNINTAHRQTLSDFIADMLNGIHDDKPVAEVVLAVLDDMVENLKDTL